MESKSPLPFGWARRRCLIVLALYGCAILSCTREPATRDTRPNILFLFSDDQRADTIGAWGNPYIRTPHMDSLAETGFSFRANYCMGSNSGAVCVPSRAMVNTGKAYFRISNDMEGVETLPQLLRRSGYTTFATGKWHNRKPSFQRSFEQASAVYFGGMGDHTKLSLVDLSADGTFVNERVESGFSSEVFADAVVEFLTGYRDDKPFYAYVPFTAPHDPRQPPESYRESYYRDRPPLPVNFMGQHPFDNGEMVLRDENLAAWPRTREVVSDQLAEYYGLITHMDDQIGRILEALKQSRHAENTYIIFASDHGLAMGSHGLLGKQSLYEHSMQSPLIVVGPEIPAGGSSEAFTYLFDLFPTIAGLAGVESPDDLDGRDLAPVWKGLQSSVRETLFLSYKDLMRSVRDARWKLIRYPPVNHSQLFDLLEDPDELNDLATEPAQQERIEELTSRLKEWQQALGDSLPLSVEDPKPLQIDLTGHERQPDRWQPEWIVRKYF